MSIPKFHNRAILPFLKAMIISVQMHKLKQKLERILID